MEAQAPPRWTAALFDLDGTLVDTSASVRSALEAAFAEVIGDDVQTDKVDLSLPLDEMIGSIEPRVPLALRLPLAAAFRRQYDSASWKLARPYPGAEECLRDLVTSGVRLFVVTNKRGKAAERLLEHFHLGRYLQGVIGQPDIGEPLPKTELARRCLASAGLDPRTTVVVGDSNQDASMAASWRMVFIGVTSGAGPLSHVLPHEERVQVVSLSDVTTFVLGGGRRK